MAGYPNSGILSRDAERKTDKHPEFKGTAEVNGVEYWLSAWVNENDRGKYFKINFKEKEPRVESTQAPSSVDKDDVPF